MLSKRRKKPSSDRIFLILAFLLIAYVMFISSDSTETKEKAAVETPATEATADGAIDLGVDKAASKLNAVKENFETAFVQPNFAKADPRITNPADLRRGAGEFALCGSEVTVHYTLLTKDDVVLADTHTNDTPATFILGQDAPEVMRWVRMHVLGMKAGGLREMMILPQWWQEEAPDVLPAALKGKLKEDALTKARVELVSVTPDANHAPVFPSIYLRTEGNVNKPIQCGQVVQAEIYNITVWRGEDIEPMTKRPMVKLELATGLGNLPKWLEQGVVGNGVMLPMMLGGARDIIVSKELLAGMNDAEKSLLAPLAMHLDKDVVVSVHIPDPDAPAVAAPSEAVKTEGTKTPEKPANKKDDVKKSEAGEAKKDDSFVPPEE